MADIAIFRINYKSDFILTLQSDAGWLTPFCIKFWTGAPSKAYYAYYDGMSYTHCTPVEGDPTKLLVQFDDHHLPIGDLKFQIGYHFTVADFPTSIEDEVINQASVIIEVDDAPAQVMLDFNGETAPEIEFSLPAYANEAQRIANEQARIAAEEQRIANEQARISAEETRQANEQQRINAEAERVSDFASLKTESEAATAAANIAATLANEKAQLADDKAALAQAAATLANAKAQLAADKAALAQAAATLANEKAALAQQKAEYAQEQGDAAKTEAETAHALNEEVRDDEEARDQAEQIRQQQETARQQAEAQRVIDFNAQMQQQQTAYADAEAARDTAFDEAETERDAKVDAKVADITNLQAQIGYFVCDTNADTAAKTVVAAGYALTKGGNIRIKMTNANTADAATLNINSTGSKALFYNGTQASSTNSWEAGEVIEVYYDGTQFMASNSQGGGGNASKIKYDSSQSGIAADNVQEALDEIGIKDAVPTEGSQRAVTSGGIYSELHEEYYEVIGTWLSGKYVDRNNSLITFSNLSCVYNLDISGYHKLIIHAQQLTNAYAVLLDEDMNIIEAYQNNTSPFDKTIDLTSNTYKNVRYVSISNYGVSNPYIHGYKYDDESLLNKVEKVEESIIELDNNVKENTNSKSLMWEIPITVQNGYIDSNGNFVEGSYQAVVDLDISEYSLITVFGNSIGAAYNVIKDENNNILARKQNNLSTSFSREDYPTAKYLSASSIGNPTLAICGIKAGIAISDMLFPVEVDLFKRKQKIIISKLDGFYNNNRAFVQSTVRISYKSNLLVVEEGWIFHLTSNGSFNTLNYITYNSSMEIVSIVRNNTYTNQEIIIPSGISYIEFFSYSTALVVSCDELESESDDSVLEGNILYKKVYVAIGDSFTAPIGSETIESGIYEGQSKVYPYIIGNRNNMFVINQGESGSVLNGYLANTRYTNIPANVDYITIWHGINDSGHGISVGTVDDEPESISGEKDTSTCGGFNWFFKWLLTNRPLAHIGVIVTDFCDATRREAIIACCQKWGIPYLDLYDPTIPMIRTRGKTRYTHDTNIAPLGYVEVCSEAKQLRSNAFSTDPSGNIHPNNTCHEWQSNLIENFMRGL